HGFTSGDVSGESSPPTLGSAAVFPAEGSMTSVGSAEGFSCTITTCVGELSTGAGGGAILIGPWGARCGRLPASETLISIATSIQFATSDDPPAARNGAVCPVSGISFVTPPSTTNNWNPRLNARPPTSSLPK